MLTPFGEKEKGERKLLKRTSSDATTNSGKEAAEKRQTIEINCKCQLSCGKLSAGDFAYVWNQFQKLQNYEQQQNFLREFVTSVPVKSRKQYRLEDNHEIKRHQTFEYTVPTILNGDKLRVCQKTFCNIFGVSRKRVKLLCSKVSLGILDLSDKRGGSRQFPKRSEWTHKIKEHIATFLTESEKFDRNDSPDVKYLSKDLNISKMFRLFQEKYSDRKTKMNPPVSYRWYFNIFRQNFQLSFQKNKTKSNSSSSDQLKTEATDLREEHEIIPQWAQEFFEK